MQAPVTDLQGFIDGLGTTIIADVNSFVGELLPYSSRLGGAIMLIYVAHKIVISFLKPDERISPATLVRPVLTLGAIVLYEDLVNLLLITPVDIVSDMVKEAANSVSGAYQTNAQSAIEHIQSTGGIDGGGIFDILQVNPLLELIHLIIYFTSTVIVAYVLFRQLIMKTIYLLLGALVLPFSLIVGNEQTLSQWFFGFLSVLLWIPIIHLILFVISICNPTADIFDNPVFSIAVQIVMIFALLEVPKYAKMLVAGQGESSVGAAYATAKGAVTDGRSAYKAMRKMGGSSSKKKK
ncbi:hypothetical protein [Aquimarina sp. 2201CG14-23]|uniref:hypothetical protein n=1 Tax=Aquimarina mycalae TaxID=3040073 RepID=UPI00247828C4|nr:hypothetical protein [Aquimarina sp. 2201CG14-23]MDH7445844.1 hypothetical protein [Aquimarina sp. 2201CG14-23]